MLERLKEFFKSTTKTLPNIDKKLLDASIDKVNELTKNATNEKELNDILDDAIEEYGLDSKRIETDLMVHEILLRGGSHKDIDEWFDEDDYETFNNPLAKYKLDFLPEVKLVLYQNKKDAKLYCRKKEGANVGKYFHLFKYFGGYESILTKGVDERIVNRSGIISIGYKNETGPTRYIRITDSSTPKMQFSLFESEKSIESFKGKPKPSISNRTLFLIEIAVIDFDEDLPPIGLIVDLPSLKRIITLLKYGESKWIYSLLKKLQKTTYLIEKKLITKIPAIDIQYKNIINHIDENFNADKEDEQKIHCSIANHKPPDFDNVYTQQLIVLQKSDISYINFFSFKEYNKIINSTMSGHEAYDSRFNSYVLFFVYDKRKFGIIVDEDVVSEFIIAMCEGSDAVKKIVDIEDLDVVHETLNLYQGDVRQKYITMDKEKQKQEEKKEQEQKQRLKEIREKMNQQVIDWKEVYDITDIGYLSTQDKIDNYLDLKDLTDKEIISLKNGEGDYFKVFEYIEKPEPLDFSFSSIDPEPIDLEDEYDLISIDELDSMVHVEAASVYTGEHIGEGGNKERDAARIKTLRVIKGKKNCMVGYPAGAVIPGRMRMTWCNRVVVEPVKGDTAALVFKYDDVSDIINNGEVMRLATIPHERIIHIGKGIDLLVNGFNYINPNDWV